MHALDFDPRPARNGDVYILPDRSKPSLDSTSAQDCSNRERELFNHLRGPQIRGSTDFDKRDAEPIERIDVLVDDLRCFLLDGKRVDPNGTAPKRYLSVDCEKRRPLEATRVRPIDYQFPHGMDLFERLHLKQKGYLERNF